MKWLGKEWSRWDQNPNSNEWQFWLCFTGSKMIIVINYLWLNYTYYITWPAFLIISQGQHNPYLELILTTRKKISSVVKHLNVKWGSSKSSSGELMLFPYNAQIDTLASHRRWTIKDSDITAADVYASIGNPAIFRLRYTSCICAGCVCNLLIHDYDQLLS